MFHALERIDDEIFVVRQVRAQRRRGLRALVRVGRAQRLACPLKHAEIVVVVAECEHIRRIDAERGRDGRKASALICAWLGLGLGLG